MRESNGLTAQVVNDDERALTASIGVEQGGRLRERRLLPTGQIDYLAKSVDLYPIRVAIVTDPLDPLNQSGEAWLEVLAHGHLRMRIAASPTEHGWTLAGFQSLGEVGSPLPPQESIPGAEATEEKVAPLEIDLDDWAACDIEGKWVRYLRDTQRHPERRRAWWRLLADQKEYDLLEWIALYEPNRYNDGVGNLLADLGAPQWTRVAAWSLQDTRLHGDHCARRELRKHPEYAIPWGKKYKESLDPTTQVTLQTLEDDLRKTGEMPVLADVSNALPPLAHGDVFGLLLDDVPMELQEFGNRQRAEANATYVHQVVRAIRGFTESGQFHDDWLKKLRQLVDHPRHDIRQEALLAYSHLPSVVIPVSDFDKIVRDDSEPATIRESALLALSYGDQPPVDAILLDVLADSSHPGWNASVSRLGDLGDEFVLTVLKQVRGVTKSKSQLQLLDDSIARIRERWDAINQALEKSPKQACAIYERRLAVLPLERAAWFDLHCHPLEHAMVTSTIELQKKRLEDHRPYRALLESIQDSYAPDDSLADQLGDGREEFQQRVRDYAKQVLDEK